MPHGSTTIRVSRRTHQLLAELARRRGSSVAGLLDRWVESARRSEIFEQYNTRMAELLADPAERASWEQETALSDVSAHELASNHASAVTR